MHALRTRPEDIETPELEERAGIDVLDLLAVVRDIRMVRRMRGDGNVPVINSRDADLHAKFLTGVD